MNLIVAMSKNRGIGLKGVLPWGTKLKNEFLVYWYVVLTSFHCIVFLILINDYHSHFFVKRKGSILTNIYFNWSRVCFSC